jgi:uncharacterized protein YutE (UPF0331/DUF86 family)/predicted nucleotidyltransferase
MKRDLCVAPRPFTPEDVTANAEGLERLFREAGVKTAVLFGSLARAAPQGGDMDVAVGGGLHDFEAEQDLHERLCRLFRADNIDLVVLDRAPFLLRKRALLGGRVLCEAVPGHLRSLIEDVLFAHEDFRYVAEMAGRRLRARLRGGLSVTERRLDAERVTAYLSQLDVSVRKLAELRRGPLSFEDFMANEDRRDLTVHHLRIALECVLDICRHFLAVKGVSLQELDTTNLIELAGVKGFLPPSFAHRIRGMAGMRNAIVHAYVNLNYRAIYDTVVRRLEEVDEFGRHVLRYLEQEGAASD